MSTKPLISDVNRTELYPCPCCGYETLPQEAGGTYELCPICFWEDDVVQLEDPDFEGGANRVSLRQAQRNFVAFGACEEWAVDHVRKPTSAERARRLSKEASN
jgi:hypothetical protein